MSTHKQRKRSTAGGLSCGGGHLSDRLGVGGGALRVCEFLQTVTLTGPCPGSVSAGFWTLQGLYPVMWQDVREAAAALLLGRFASVRVLVFLEGQQVGLLLLQLPLELLGLALLLELPPFILLSAGRIKLNQNNPDRLMWERFILTTQPLGQLRLDPDSAVAMSWDWIWPVVWK